MNDIEFEGVGGNSRVQMEERKITVPQYRMGALKQNWEQLYSPVVEHMGLQIRMNVYSKKIELRTSPYTEDVGAIQRAEDFIRCFLLGFDVEDALAMLRLNDLYVESFEVCDVKTLHGDNLARAVGRIAGKDGRTKFAIENSTRTRIVINNTRISILGSVSNIRIARDAICDLIMGSPPGKIYNRLRMLQGHAIH